MGIFLLKKKVLWENGSGAASKASTAGAATALLPCGTNGLQSKVAPKSIHGELRFPAIVVFFLGDICMCRFFHFLSSGAEGEVGGGHLETPFNPLLLLPLTTPTLRPPYSKEEGRDQC